MPPRFEFRLRPVIAASALGLGLIVVGILVAYRASTSACSGAMVEQTLAEVEPQIGTHEGLFHAYDELWRALLRCDHGRFGLPVYVFAGFNRLQFGEGEQVPKRRVEQLCPGLEQFTARLGAANSDDRHRWQFEYCGFASYGLLKPDELERVTLPPPEFGVSAQEVFNSGLEPEVARRLLRIMLLAQDAFERTPDMIVIERGALRGDHYQTKFEQLELTEPAGQTSEPALRRFFEGWHGRSAPPIPISIEPDALARDLRWLREIEDRWGYATATVHIAARERLPSGLPIVATILLGPAELDGESKVLTYRFVTDGVLAWEPHEPPPGVPWPWGELGAALDEQLDRSGAQLDVDVELDGDVPASVFLPALIELDRRLGLRRHPRLVLPD